PPARPRPHIAPHLAVSHDGSYARLFETRTRWIAHALSRGRHIPRNLLYKLVRRRNLDTDHLAVWVDVLHRRDPIYALDKLGLLESANRADEVQQEPSSSESDVVDCPNWLYNSIPAMVSCHHHAPYLVSQLLSDRFARRLDEKSRSVFLARCIQHFIKVRHYVALRETIEFIAFASIESSSNSKARGGGGGATRPIRTEASFGRILDALSSERVRTGRITSAPRELLHSLRDVVVSVMKERHVSRTSLATWLPLFSPALISQDPRDALELVADMARAGWQPKRKVLHQVLKVVVRNGCRAGTDAAVRIRHELTRDRSTTSWTPSRSILSQLSRGSEDEIPLHLRDARSHNKANAVARAEEVNVEINRVEPGREEAETERTGAPPAPEEDRRRSLPTPDSLEDPTTSSRTALSLTTVTESTSPRRKSKSLTSTTRTSIRAVRRTRQEIDSHATTHLLDLSVSLPYFDELRDYVATRDSRSPPPFPRPPFPSDTVAWCALFQSVVHEPSIDYKLLLAILRRLEVATLELETSSRPPPNSYIPPRPTLRLYTIVMRCLLARKARHQVVALFRKLELEGWTLDATVIDLQVRALCALGRERDAFRLVRSYEHLPSVHDRSNLTSLRTPPPRRPTSSTTVRGRRRHHSIRLDIVPFNSILSHLNLSARHHRAWTLFNELEPRHQVRPDVATMSIMLDAARYASIDAGRGWAGGFGLGDVYLVGGGDRKSGRGLELGSHVRVGGARQGGAMVNDKWDGIAASKKMELVVWDEVFESNWQDVELENPLEPRSGVSRWLHEHFSSSTPSKTTTPPSSSPTLSSSIDSSKAGGGGGRRQGSFADRSEPPPNWRPFATTLSPRPPRRPDLHPTDPLFRSLILLTGVHSHIPLIGQVLAWARYTNVRLSRYTLCVALLFVEGEAAIKRDRVARLRRWLAEWLGPENVPDEDEIAWMRRGGTAKGKPRLQ
ncbi:hypothetical protein JCM3766R1_001838, partial [Sporobolomyces carnicolor]